MTPLNLLEVTQYIEDNIYKFHEAKLEGLKKLKLIEIIKKKNPYLSRAKHGNDATNYVRSITDAFISSKEETIFGNWMEGLAIFVNNKVFGGAKSSADGIDLEFTVGNVRYIIAIKSGPNWGNGGQINKMKLDFAKATRTIQTSGSGISVEAINGCCYGKDNKPHKLNYQKLCGQAFWYFISANKDLYIDIIEPMGHEATKRNMDFQDAYDLAITKFTLEFIKDFCKPSGEILWEKIVTLNSETKVPKPPKPPKAKKVATKKAAPVAKKVARKKTLV